MNIIISPYNVTSNQYINITRQALSEAGYRVRPIRWSLLFSRRKNVFIGNWLEDHVAGSGFKRFRGFFQSLAKISFGRLAAKRFTLVRHNLEPHYGKKKSKLYRLMLWMLEKTSDIKCSHAKYMDEYHYNPHPLYASSAASCSQLERDKKFVYFGHITRYKKLDELLNSWPVEEKLELHGKCYDT